MVTGSAMVVNALQGWWGKQLSRKRGEFGEINNQISAANLQDLRLDIHFCLPTFLVDKANASWHDCALYICTQNLHATIGSCAIRFHAKYASHVNAFDRSASDGGASAGYPHASLRELQHHACAELSMPALRHENQQ